MIYRLFGTISHVQKDAFVLRSGDIEWYIEASATTLSRLPRDGKEVGILTHLHHREDQMQLFGFFDAREKEVFEALLSVSGIGPRAAVKILSGIDAESFVVALENEDLGRLESVPGLGKKSAQKILLALTGKLRLESNGPTNADTSVPRDYAEMEEALVSMGYDRRLVREALPAQAAATKRSLFGEERSIESLEKGERERFEAELLRACIVALS